MKKVSKAILIALGILIAVIAVAVLGVNLYIQSAGTQARIQRALSKGLHTPVKIASLNFTPWSGVKLSGITGQDENAAANENVLQIAQISARIQLWKLLRREVVIKQLTVDRAKVAWNQGDGNKWQLPLQPAPVESEPVTPPTPDAQPSPPAVQPTPEIQPSTPPPPAPNSGFNNTVQAVAVKINRFRLKDSSFDLGDREHKSIVSVSGIDMVSPHPAANSVAGFSYIAQIAVRNLFFIRDCQSEFHYTAEQFSLFNARATIADGSATGSLNVKTGQPDSPFNLDLKLAGIQVEKLFAEAGITDAQASGSLEGFLRLQGNVRNSAAAAGSGQLSITSGRISHIQFFTELGNFFHTTKLQQFDLKQVLVNYHIGDGKVYVDEIALQASDLSLTGRGTIDMAGGLLFLKCRLSIGASITRQVPEVLMENFGRDEVANTHYVDFEVFNTISSPRTNLQKVIGSTIEHGAKNIWKSIFGKPKAQPVLIPAQPVPVPAQQIPAPVLPMSTSPQPFPSPQAVMPAPAVTASPAP